MRKTSMPGFTAALSLGVSTQRYVSGPTAYPKRGATAVVPSLHFKAGLTENEVSEVCPGYCHVIDNICVCPDGGFRRSASF
jgi:hypothetical protein